VRQAADCNETAGFSIGVCGAGYWAAGLALQPSPAPSTTVHVLDAMVELVEEVGEPHVRGGSFEIGHDP
jgi:hypothetical protein